MFKRFSVSNSSGNASVELAGVTYQLGTLSLASAGHEAVTTSMQVYGGNEGGDAVIVIAPVTSGAISEDAITGLYKLSVGPQETLTIDTRELFAATDCIYFGSSVSGLRLFVAADVSEVL